MTMLGYWEMSLLKETIYWILFVGFPLLMSTNKINSEENYIKVILKNAVKGIVIIEFIANFYNFSLVGELILIPVITFIGILQVVSDNKPEHQQVSKLLNWILTIFGLIVLIYAVYKVYQSPREFFSVMSLKTFLLSIILTILFIPFLYFVALYSLYETVFITLERRLKKKSHKRYLRRKMYFTFHLNRGKLRRFQQERVLDSILNKKDLRKMLKKFRQS